MRILIVGLLPEQQKNFLKRMGVTAPNDSASAHTFLFAPKDKKYKVPKCDAVILSKFVSHPESQRLQDALRGVPFRYHRGSTSTMNLVVKELNSLENSKGNGR